MSPLTELSTFEADAIDTAKRLEELAAHIEARYPGGAAICRRGSKFIWETVASTEKESNE